MKPTKLIACSLLAVCALAFLSLSILAQKQKASAPWESKPIDQWNNDDVAAILGHSSWSFTISGRMATSVSAPGFDASVAVPAACEVTLRSALIVRYAMVRKRQLMEKFDSMDETKKADFNKRNKATLECPACEQFYVISIIGDSRILQQPSLVQNRFSDIYLKNEKGEKRVLAKYNPQTISGSEAVFFFPRFDEHGRPLLTPENKTFTFHFPYRESDDPVILAVQNIEINVADITRSGQVIF
jgi:hypothetical protein